MKKHLLSVTTALFLSIPLAVAAQQQSYITGTVQGPDGAALDGATIYVCTGLVKAEREARENGKTRMVLYYSSAQPGSGKCEGTGKTSKGGLFKVRYPEGKQADLFAWKAGHEALIMRGVSSPSELGVLKLPGTNDSAAVERRNIETAQRTAQQKAKNREIEGQRRQKAWEERVRAIFGNVAPTVLDIEARVGKNRPETQQAHLQIITAHWDEIQRIIREELPPRAQVAALMRSCGMPMTPADLGLTMQDTLDALLGSREIRDKYLTSSLLWDMGLLDETAEKLKAEMEATGGCL